MRKQHSSYTLLYYAKTLLSWNIIKIHKEKIIRKNRWSVRLERVKLRVTCRCKLLVAQRKYSIFSSSVMVTYCIWVWLRCVIGFIRTNHNKAFHRKVTETRDSLTLISHFCVMPVECNWHYTEMVVILFNLVIIPVSHTSAVSKKSGKYAKEHLNQV